MWLHSVADSQTKPVLTQSPVSRTNNRITLITPDASTRTALQAFIQGRYAEEYGADVSHFLPLLLTSTSDENIQGVLGLHPGSTGRFFVEQYLSEPIETLISTVTHHAVQRRRVIETGNLASLKGSSQRLFIMLTELLYQAGFDWVCFTATPQVATLLHRLGFAPEVLSRADPECLPDRGLSWGRYYDNKPMVLVGDVRKARQTLIRNELAIRLLQDSSNELEAAVHVLTRFSQCTSQHESNTRG